MSARTLQSPGEKKLVETRSGVHVRHRGQAGAPVENGEAAATERPPPPEVESILLEYLRRSTAPAMPRVMSETIPVARSMAPTVRPPKEATPSDPAIFGAATIPNFPRVRVVDMDAIVEASKAPAPSFIRDRGVLVRMDGERMGELTSLPNEASTIGRDRDADLHVADVSISREHARIVREGALYFVEDMGSVNGTFVNSKRVTRAELANGDCVQLGPRVSFRFSLMDEAQEGVLSRLYDSSVRDPLTGIYNRRHLDARLAGEIAHAVRHGENVSMLLFDIDFFKNVNDRYGHPAGDEVLRVVADLAKRVIRAEDVLARYGGEEFAIVLRDTPVEGAHVLAERVRRRVADTTIPIGSVAVGVTISAGCSSLRCVQNTSVAALVQAADRRLYRAKRDGRNRVISTG